jgi:tRNA(adenine34) deaminase
MTPQQTDLQWMNKALSLAAEAAECGEVPVGALVVSEGVCIGQSFNAPISRVDPTAHAEISALRAAAKEVGNYRLPGATLYVTIEPCMMCAGALIHARIKRLVFGAREPRAGVISSNMRVLEQSFFNHRIEWQEGVCADQCASMMKAFFSQRR